MKFMKNKVFSLSKCHVQRMTYPDQHRQMNFHGIARRRHEVVITNSLSNLRISSFLITNAAEQTSNTMMNLQQRKSGPNMKPTSTHKLNSHNSYKMLIQCKDSKKITNYRKLHLRNVPSRMPKTAVRQRLFSDFDQKSIDWSRETTFGVCQVKGTKQMTIEFPNVQLCRLARRIVNLINYQGIEANFALENPKNEPKISKPVLNRNDGDETGVCEQCHEEGAEFVCSNCLTESTAVYYCNEDHQSKHWDLHRWDCRKLPKLIGTDEIDSHLETEKMDNFEPHEPKLVAGEYAKITHIESPKIFYLRSATADYNGFSSLVEDRKNPTPLTNRPRMNNIHCILRDGKYQRVKIVYIDEEGFCTLFLIDYGKTLNKVHWKELTLLTYQRRKNPKQTTKVYLKDVNVTEDDAEMSQQLKNLFENKIVLIKSLVERGGKRITVLERPRGEIVNQMIRKFTNSQDQDSMEESEFHGDKKELNFDEYDHLQMEYE